MLEFADEAFDEMPLFIKLLVVRMHLKAVGARRNHGFNSHRCNASQNRIRVIRLIPKHLLDLEAFQQSLR